MKRILALSLSFVMLCALQMGCAASSVPAESDPSSDAPSQAIRVAALTGPTAMGLVRLMDDTSGRYDFTLAGSADEITPLLANGSLDLAAIPANLASVLYNKTEGEIQVLAVNTLGVLYIVEKNAPVSELTDLVGKTVYATGKNAVPEMALRRLLSLKGIDPDKDLDLVFKTEPSEVVSILNEADSAIAMLPQPYVTVAKSKVEGLNTALSLNEVWSELNAASPMITGVLVGRKRYIEAHADEIHAFLDAYEQSVLWVNENLQEAAALIEKHEIITASVAEKAILECNIVCIRDDLMRSHLQAYFADLFGDNVKAIGGQMPGDDFYYHS